LVNYENLAVYKSSFDLAVYFEKIVKNFDKGNKFTIGTDLKNKSRQIAMQVIRANVSNKKIADIQELIILIEELKLVVRLCQEINGFPNKNSHGYVSKLITNLTTQANNWLLCSQKREQTETPGIVNVK
jgi:hypothetical protein